jgi:probable DNA metabolism protein
VLGLLAEHFRERFMNHAWVIHDKRRGLAAIYDGNEYIIESAPKEAGVDFTDEEGLVQELWKSFYTTIGIKERRNDKLRRQLLPLYFRGNMTEFTRNPK